VPDPLFHESLHSMHSPKDFTCLSRRGSENFMAVEADKREAFG
jgi:hypothetical protein